MSRLLALTLCTLALLSTAASAAAQDAAAAPTGQRVEIPSGQPPLVKKGTVVGRTDVAFLASLKKGQTLVVDLQSPSTSIYFNVLPAGTPEALYASDRGDTGNKATVAIPADGDYRIVVYLFRNAARRGAKAPFTLTLSLK